MFFTDLSNSSITRGPSSSHSPFRACRTGSDPHQTTVVVSQLPCAYLNQLWQKDLQVSVWYLLKEVNRCPAHSWIGKAEKDEGPVDLAMSGANVYETNTQTQE